MTPEMEDRVDDYLASRLSDDELDAIEIEMLGNIQLQHYVAEQVALRDAFKSESRLLLEPTPPSIWERIHDLLTSTTWAYASSVALLFLVPLVFLSESELRRIDAEPAVWRNVEFTRSSSNADINIPAGVTVMLSIDAFGMDLISPDFRLIRDDETVVNLRDLQADDLQLLNVVLSPLPKGNYVVELTRGAKEPVRLQLVAQ